MKRSVLEYLADRLQRIDEPECQAAFQAAAAALDNFDAVNTSAATLEDLFHTMWDHISRSLDHAEYPKQFERELDAIEAELAGHVLGSQLRRGGFLPQSPAADNSARPSMFRAWLNRVF